jgi:hypothetical protein
MSTVLWLYFFYATYGVLDPEAPYGAYTRLYVLTRNIPHGLVGLLFDQKFGLLVYSPIYLLACVGAWVLVRSRETRWLGIVLVLVVIGVAAALLGPVVRGPTAFFDELGKTINRYAPQPQSDIRSDEQLKAVIKAMPQGRLRVGTIVEEQDRVVFTVTADRAAVRAAVRPGDELRMTRDGNNVEIAPTGVPGMIDSLQRALEDLKRKFFGP